MSLFRSLNDAALAANLNKNEAKVFLALMNQTIGFGKSVNHLTHKRLANLTNMRLDRLYPAIEGVIKKGLFEVEDSTYYDYRYQIATVFINENPVFFTPHLPKNRKNIRKEETPSVFKNVAPKNRDIYNITSTSFNLTLFKPQQPRCPAELTITSLPQPVVVDVDKKLPKKSEPTPPTAKPIVCQTEQPQRPATPADPIPPHFEEVELLPLFKQKDHSTCRNALHDLSLKQQQRVMKTIEIKEKMEVIYNPVGLLIVLAKAERKGCLIIPKITSHASHRTFEEQEAVKKKESTGLEDHFGKLNWLKDNTNLGEQSLRAFAEKMEMSHYLEDTCFVQHWLAYHAKQMKQPIQALAVTLGLEAVLPKE
ncbi:MAG: replication protein [Cocleimonas sp.]|nr:replication protein [Cocleimonas sp.]